MAEQIKKIIFTTKEAYDQKVAAGALEPDVIYAIEASQTVTPTEVKTAVDNGFDKFGLTLGIDEAKAEFYKLPISLTEMLKDIVRDKVDANYTDDSSLLVANGRTIKIPDVFRNTVVTVKQNGTDFGMLKYKLEPTIEEDPSESSTRVATLELPGGIDLAQGFEVILANVFGTKTHIVNFTPTFETVVKNKLDEIVGRFYFDQNPRVYISDNPYGDLGNFDYQVKYFENTDEGKDNFRNNVDNIFRPFGVAFVAIPDKSLINSAVLKKIQDITSSGNYFLITNLEMTEYYDSVKNVWAAMPTDKNTEINKILEYCGYYFNHLATNNLKADDAVNRIDRTPIDASSRFEASDVTVDSENEERLRAADVIQCYLDGSNAEVFIDTLISLNNTRPLTTKGIAFVRGINQSVIDKLAALSSLQVVRFENSNEYYTIPENFKPLLVADNHMYLEVVKGRIATYIDIPSVVRSLTDSVY